MKKNIYSGLLLTGFVSILMTALLITLVFHSAFRKQVEKDITLNAILISRFYSSEDGADSIKSIRADGLRLTLITPQGHVLYESDKDTSEMENHADRPEVLQALRTGSGSATRVSATFGMNTIYYALRLSDGNVLRVSSQVSGITAIFISTLPAVVAITASVFVLCLVLSGVLTRKALKPVEEIASSPEMPEKYERYEELAPFAKIINQQRREIHGQLEKNEQEKSKIEALIKNMGEGLLLVGVDTNILMINSSAITLMSCAAMDYKGKNILRFTRNESLLSCISTALKKGSSHTEEISIGNRRLQISASPVFSGRMLIGALCLIFDVTKSYEMERYRRDFTANVSHELKTPLTSISGYAELISSGIAKEEDIKGFAGRIKSESDRLLGLIGDIIQLSELDDEHLKLKTESFDLLELCEECVRSLSFLAGEREVEIRSGGVHSVIKADRALIAELIVNLGDNAIRYSNKGCKVDITVRENEGRVILSVKDNGIGIPKEHQSRIFERFYRVDKSRSKQTGGTGLGLAIVKHIAEQHGASLKLQSAEGLGTTVEISFNIY
ncbi:MAG: ATP-binding protein [Eubacteriales bacterium]